MGKKLNLICFFMTVAVVSLQANNHEKVRGSQVKPVVVEQFFEKAKKNDNWKQAFVTGEHEQIVFMNVSRSTNPNNEIGKETHDFDQVIVIVQGNGKSILGGQTSFVKEGDMIFIPEGIEHNVINLNQDKELKLISFYSDTDIPKDAVYKKKADETND